MSLFNLSGVDFLGFYFYGGLAATLFADITRMWLKRPPGDVPRDVLERLDLGSVGYLARGAAGAVDVTILRLSQDRLLVIDKANERIQRGPTALFTGTLQNRAYSPYREPRRFVPRDSLERAVFEAVPEGRSTTVKEVRARAGPAAIGLARPLIREVLREVELSRDEFQKQLAET